MSGVPHAGTELVCFVRLGAPKLLGSPFASAGTMDKMPSIKVPMCALAARMGSMRDSFNHEAAVLKVNRKLDEE